jgi:cytochrome P450
MRSFVSTRRRTQRHLTDRSVHLAATNQTFGVDFTRVETDGVQIDDDILSPEAVADPHSYFARLREHEPVRFNEQYRAWIVTRHSDVSAGFRGGKLSSDRIQPYVATLPAEERLAREPTFRVLLNWMVFMDPPDHTRLRRLVYRAFIGPALEPIASRVQEIVDDLLDDLAGRSESDLLSDFAYPLPAIVIAEMLGAPPDERDLFKKWSDDITGLVFAASESEDRHERAQAGLIELWNYLSELVERYRRAPAENLISELIAVEEEGERLTREELIATCALLLFGGHETTTNLIASGTRALLQHPGEAQRLRDHPALIPTAVEELLRYDGPTKMSFRVAAIDHEIGGRNVAAGDRVFLITSAANRDPEVFDRPDDLDVRRDPNRHVGFGFGPHYCLGASLARLEGRIAIRTILDRLEGLRLIDDELQWHPTMLSRGLVALPLAFDELRPRLPIQSV